MTNKVGRLGFKDHITFFMKTDEERKEHEDRRVQKVLQRFRVLCDGLKSVKRCNECAPTFGMPV
jgi:hypothetical protein